MVGEIFVILVFWIICGFQVNRIRKIRVFMKKDFIYFTIIIIGIVTILGITIKHGQSLIHYIFGVSGTLIFVLTLFIFGITNKSIIHTFPAGSGSLSVMTFVGKNIKIDKISKVRIEEKRKKLILKFIYYGSEYEMNFRLEERQNIQDILSNNGKKTENL